MAGAGRVRRSRRLREAPHRRAAAAAGVAPEEWRDWAGGLPAEVLATIAGKVVAQTEAGWAAGLEEWGWSEGEIQEEMAKRKREGNCPLFVFARVCKLWRKAQLKVGGPLRSRVYSDVIMPGSVALAEWALAEGCPWQTEIANLFRRTPTIITLAVAAARRGRRELVQLLCGGVIVGDKCVIWPMDQMVMEAAVSSGNLELVRWLRAEGCPWTEHAKDRADYELDYIDNFGNLVDRDGNPVQ